MQRIDNRRHDQMRPVKFTCDIQEFALGSVLVEYGKTKVICAVSLDEKVPPFLKGSGNGWLTAEYAMLPASADSRTPRENVRPNGRNKEISRLIGRALRSVLDKKALGERTFTVDCDVLQADGGTRTAAISGAYVALSIACLKLQKMGLISKMPLKEALAAISCGIKDDELLLDLNYVEDSSCAADFNIVMAESGKLAEVQASAEGELFTHEQFQEALNLCREALKEVYQKQAQAISEWQQGYEK